jgi:GTP-binding protein HflX
MPDNPEGQRFQEFTEQDLSHIQMDFLNEIREIETEFRNKADLGIGAKNRDRALIVGIRHKDGGSTEASMDELKELAESAGLVVARSYMQSRLKLDPHFLIGKGKLHELVLDSMQLGAEIIIFDCSLSAAQARGISAQADVEVLDRNQLILALFGQRARTRAGALQVELASLRYELPRLHERAEGLSRITGGIGARGPGETKLEIHRRRVRDRITALEKQIEQISTQRQARRKRRQERNIPVVSIIGYTNSGKSTLLNRLTSSEVLAEQRMFATLDPTSRRVRTDAEHEFVLTDTVGFIRDLPDELVQAFQATLEELEDADLLIHLVDVSNPNHDRHLDSVELILGQLGLEDIPLLLVYNKVDILERQGIELEQESDGPLLISAHLGQGVPQLLNTILSHLWPDYRPFNPNDENTDVADQL